MSVAVDRVASLSFELGDSEFRYLREFVLENCGITLGEHKRQLVIGRLSSRLRALGFDSFREYCDLLRRNPHAELGALASAISTNVTAFFRESHHFDLLRDELLPALLAAPSGSRVRIWSAGCATGEEPYSIAMVLAEALACRGGAVDARVLATDLSPQALETAQRGVYRVDRLGDVDTTRQKRWFKRGTGLNDGLAIVAPVVRELVTFRPLNLLHDWPMAGPFDAIFCRNVVIYFDKSTKERLFARFADMLAPRGHLFLGHSESLYGLSSAFEAIGRTTYRKLGEAAR